MYSKYRNHKRESILHKYHAEIFGAIAGLLLAYATVQYVDDRIEFPSNHAEVKK